MTTIRRVPAFAVNSASFFVDGNEDDLSALTHVKVRVLRATKPKARPSIKNHGYVIVVEDGSTRPYTPKGSPLFASYDEARIFGADYATDHRNVVAVTIVYR